MQRLLGLMAAASLVLSMANTGHADDDVPPSPPEAVRESAPEVIVPESFASESLPPPMPQPEDAPLEILRPIDVVAPRINAGPGTRGEARSVTALRIDRPTFDIPRAVSVIEEGDLRIRRPARSLSGALQGMPGVLVQKTAPLQHSPFIRGFTGYQNVLLIDGMRLNHSAMRSGPNQYWATVDPLSIDRLEVVRGPHSVLYGSDAVGGTVNALPWRRTSFRRGLHTGGHIYTRLSSAERSAYVRGAFEGNKDNLGWAVGVGHKTWGDTLAGSGVLPGTGGIREWNADMRFDYRLSRAWTLSAGWQHMRQIDAPRTERTVDAVPFAGSSVGTELRRDYDQNRDLVYARLAFDGGDCCRPFSSGHLTVHYHRHDEERDRLRTGDRRDLSGFTLDQFGVQFQLVSPTNWGRFTYGAEYIHDTVDSFDDRFVAGVAQAPRIQGPLGDDGTYDLLAVYLQNELELSRRLTLIAGVRYTYASTEIERVDNPAVAGSNPATAGNVIEVDNDWSDVVGSLQARYCVNSMLNLYGGVSQAFRAPTMYDLTSFDTTSVVETPSPNLDSERYLSFELGAKAQHRRWRFNLSGYYTQLEDTIIRSPTGVLIMGVPEVRKDNIGDGFVTGIEFDALYQINPCWSAFGTFTWMDGEVDQLDTNGNLVRRPVTRLKPLSTLVGVRYEPPGSKFWAQAEWEHSEDADKLSLRDETDTRRIPPGGTPGFDVFHLRAGMRFSDRLRMSLSLENLTDENYRIHGSGVNEPGINAIFGLEIDF